MAGSVVWWHLSISDKAVYNIIRQTKGDSHTAFIISYNIGFIDYVICLKNHEGEPHLTSENISIVKGTGIFWLIPLGSTTCF